jgi:hypothetical protein
LRHYWIAKKAEEKSPNVREKQLYRMIAQDISGSQQATLRLLEDLRSSAINYASISDYGLWPDDSAYDDSFAESLGDLRLFRVTQCNPLLLNAMQRFANPKDVVKTFRIVANFSFRYFIIGNQSPGNLERVSASIAYDIRASNFTSPDHIADALRVVSPDQAFRSDFTYATFPKTRARIARYTLAKISNYLAHSSRQGGAEQIVNPDSRQVTLEHIIPQDLRQPWPSYFPTDVDPEAYVYRIGNMTLLTAKVNRAAADASFPEKKRIALNSSDLSINKSFQPINQWGPQEIEQRQEFFAKTAIEVWKL